MLALRVTELGWQIVVGPAAVITGTKGVNTVNVIPLETVLPQMFVTTHS